MIQSISASELHHHSDRVVIDVRTPLEFQQGHIPGAVNIPLLSNEERVVIGTLYKQEGRQAAILKGFELVGSCWADFIRTGLELAPEKKVVLYCWRGGMRSGSMAWAFTMYGFDVLLVKGGYKAFRNFALETFQIPLPIQILSGKTGSAKTKILHELQNHGATIIDLEGLAKHQGSSFGSMGKNEQPTQEQFENNLHREILRVQNSSLVWVLYPNPCFNKCKKLTW
jgi:tRNA 2-selenouridine synthase